MNLLSEDARLWLDEHVDAYIDGDLPESEVAEFERLRSKAGDFESEIYAARRIRSALRSFEKYELPAAASQRLGSWKRHQVRAAFVDRVRSRLRIDVPRLWRPVAAMGVLTALVVVASLVGKQESVPAHSTAEVEQALADAKWAIDYMADMGRTTGKPVRVTLLDEGVRAPVKRAINSIIHTDEDFNSNE